IAFTVLMFVVIVVFNILNDSSVVNAVFKVAGFTYGPLLGLFVYGLFTKKPVKDRLVPFICILAPILSVVLDQNSESWFGGYKFGFEILLVNAFLTIVGLYLISKRNKLNEQPA